MDLSPTPSIAKVYASLANPKTVVSDAQLKERQLQQRIRQKAKESKQARQQSARQKAEARSENALSFHAVLEEEVLETPADVPLATPQKAPDAIIDIDRVPTIPEHFPEKCSSSSSSSSNSGGSSSNSSSSSSSASFSAHSRQEESFEEEQKSSKCSKSSKVVEDVTESPQFWATRKERANQIAVRKAVKAMKWVSSFVETTNNAMGNKFLKMQNLTKNLEDRIKEGVFDEFLKTFAMQPLIHAFFSNPVAGLSLEIGDVMFETHMNNVKKTSQDGLGGYQRMNPRQTDEKKGGQEETAKTPGEPYDRPLYPQHPQQPMMMYPQYPPQYYPPYPYFNAPPLPWGLQPPYPTPAPQQQTETPPSQRIETPPPETKQPKNEEPQKEPERKAVHEDPVVFDAQLGQTRRRLTCLGGANKENNVRSALQKASPVLNQFVEMLSEKPEDNQLPELPS